MDDSLQPSEVVGHPLQGPHGHSGFRKPLPGDFVPLRLLLPAGAPALVVTAPDMVLGRHSEADLRLPFADVSRRHCRFVFTGGHWQVIDLQSLNGVWINEQPVQRAPLHHGDRLRIGELLFTVDLASLANTSNEGRSAEPSLYELFRASLPHAQASPPPRRRAG